MEWKVDKQIHHEVAGLVAALKFTHIDAERLIVFRSFGSKSRAQARIWSLPKIWQIALGVQAHYCLEVLSEKYNRLSRSEQKKTLIHELLHIPKTFSGALLSHRGRGWRIDSREVEKYYRKVKRL